jgi:hypothetical protein
MKLNIHAASIDGHGGAASADNEHRSRFLDF